jgi:hypothetical protein
MPGHFKFSLSDIYKAASMRELMQAAVFASLKRDDPRYPLQMAVLFRLRRDTAKALDALANEAAGELREMLLTTVH